MEFDAATVVPFSGFSDGRLLSPHDARPGQGAARCRADAASSRVRRPDHRLRHVCALREWMRPHVTQPLYLIRAAATSAGVRAGCLGARPGPSKTVPCSNSSGGDSVSEPPAGGGHPPLGSDCRAPQSPGDTSPCNGSEVKETVDDKGDTLRVTSLVVGGNKVDSGSVSSSG